MKQLKNALEETLSTVKDKEIYQMVLDLLYLLNKKKSQEIIEKKSTMLELPTGTKVWVLNPEALDINDFNWGKAILHRENDLPAVEYRHGTKEWCKENKLHRENDLPAIEYLNGRKEWWKEGKRHRGNDKPAIEFPGGEKWWFKEGKKHRDNNKPAIIWHNGKKEYWINGTEIK